MNSDDAATSFENNPAAQERGSIYETYHFIGSGFI